MNECFVSFDDELKGRGLKCCKALKQFDMVLSCDALAFCKTHEELVDCLLKKASQSSSSLLSEQLLSLCVSKQGGDELSRAFLDEALSLNVFNVELILKKSS